MGKLSGITIILVQQTQTGVDAFNNPIYSETQTQVENVLVGESTTDDITNSINLYGKKAQFTLGIPKGDTHNWTDAIVILPAPFTGRYRTIGYPICGIEALIPMQWDKKVMVERYG